MLPGKLQILVEGGVLAVGAAMSVLRPAVDHEGVSRVCNDTREILAQLPGEVALERRERSFVTLDAPTWIEDRSREEKTLLRRLILPLVELRGEGSRSAFSSEGITMAGAVRDLTFAEEDIN